MTQFGPGPGLQPQHLLSHPAAGLSGRLGLLPTRLTRFSRSGQTEWHSWGPRALGRPPFLFRRALWTPPPPWASVHPAPAENYTLSSDTGSLHRRNRHSLAQNKHTFLLLLLMEALLVSSVTRACCGQNVIPGSVLGGGGHGGSLAGRAPSARRLCGAQGVWAEPQQPQAVVGQPLASPRWLWGLPVGGPCQVTFRWHCPGSAAGPMSAVLGPRGGDQEALFTAVLSVPTLSPGRFADTGIRPH